MQSRVAQLVAQLFLLASMAFALASRKSVSPVHHGHESARSSIGGLLKSLGYSTGQFGKITWAIETHHYLLLMDLMNSSENLYHLNAEEEPELPDYPKDPAYIKKFGPRGILKCTLLL